MSTTATDMARFMIAHLQEGRFENVQVLRPETVRLMHSRQLPGRPEVNGMTLGFAEESSNGHRILGHDGGSIFFRTKMTLIVDSGVGFFMSYNSAGRGGIRSVDAPRDAFVNRYFPSAPAIAPTQSPKSDGQPPTGLYMMSRRSDHTFGRLAWILGEVTVSSAADGTIVASDYLSMKPKRWREISPRLYREVDGQDQIFFERDSMGRMTLFPGPAVVYHKVLWWDDKRLNLGAAGFMAVVMVFTLVLWPAVALVRRCFGRRRLNWSSGDRKWRLTVWIICAFDIAIIATCVVMLLSSPQHMELLTAGLDPWLYVLQWAGLAAVFATAVPLCNVLYLFRQRHLSWVTRVHGVLIALACIIFACLMVNWNFVNISVRY